MNWLGTFLGGFLCGLLTGVVVLIIVTLLVVDSMKVKRPLTKAEWKMGLHPDQIDAVNRVWLGMIISMIVVMWGVVVAVICYR